MKRSEASLRMAIIGVVDSLHRIRHLLRLEAAAYFADGGILVGRAPQRDLIEFRALLFSHPEGRYGRHGDGHSALMQPEISIFSSPISA